MVSYDNLVVVSQRLEIRSFILHCVKLFSPLVKKCVYPPPVKSSDKLTF